MKKMLVFSFCWAFLLVGAGCIKTKVKGVATAKTTEQPDYKALGYVPATVTDMTGLDGCGFMLLLENNQKLEASNLKDDFKQNNLKVWIKYHADKKAMSICMAGQKVVLDAIEKRE